MDTQIGKEYQHGTIRTQFLKDNCDSVEEKGYMKYFDTTDLQTKKERLAEASIQRNEIEVEKKELMDVYKERLKPYEKEISQILIDLKNKAEYVKEEVFKFVDQESRMVGYYNSFGDLIESRPCNADELTIFSSIRKVTN